MGTDFVDTFNIIITFIGLGITYYSVFRVAEAIEKKTGDETFQSGAINFIPHLVFAI